MILASKRAVLYAGGGVITSDASDELRELADLTHIPVTTTLMGLGCFPSRHPLSLGMLGMHGSYATNMAICQCDLLIAVGARFDDRVTGRLNGFAHQRQEDPPGRGPLRGQQERARGSGAWWATPRRALRALVAALKRRNAAPSDGKAAVAATH